LLLLLLEELTIGSVGHEGDIPRPLNGNRENALVSCAVTAYSSWQNLATLGDELLQTIGVFVVNKIYLVGAKAAGLSSSWGRILHRTHHISSN
jgi:hypothetical protein